MNRKSINIGIEKVRITRFIVTPEGALMTTPNQRNFGVETKLDFVSKSEKQFKCIFSVSLNYLEGEERGIPLATVEMETDFNSSNLTDFTIDKEDGKQYFKRPFVNVIFDIIFSQMRGAFAALFMGKALEWFTLPLLNGERALGNTTEFLVKKEGS